MAKYAVNDEGVEALNNLSARLPELLEEIENSVTDLQGELDSSSSGIGPHAESIAEVVEEVKEITKNSTAPVDEISEDVADKAKDYQAAIDHDRYKVGN